MTYTRVLWVVLDSVGIGAMPDAAEFGDDPASDTLGNIARRGLLRLPNLRRLGLANIRPFEGLEAVSSPAGAYGRCALASPGKDTTTGHWEMAGVHLEKPFPLYPRGFPLEVMEPFEHAIGRGSLGNKAASGTEIIQELGEEHVRSARPIVYTSADSVFQIAAHEEILSLEELYRICRIAREILRGEHEVGRVIARPFVGTPGSFTRTANRKDFAVPPPAGMLLDRLSETGVPVIGVGKISDVFLGRGIARSEKTNNNAEGMARVVALLDQEPVGLIYVNLVDFDQLYGHRNDVEGYARALEEVDAWLPSVEARMRAADLLILTADHGCDPTTPSTDHSREYVPLLAASPGLRHASQLGTRASLADIGQTVAENFHTSIAKGESFLAALAG